MSNHTRTLGDVLNIPSLLIYTGRVKPWLCLAIAASKISLNFKEPTFGLNVIDFSVTFIKE